MIWWNITLKMAFLLHVNLYLREICPSPACHMAILLSLFPLSTELKGSVHCQAQQFKLKGLPQAS